MKKIIVLLLGIFLLTGCTNHKAITKDSFVEIMENRGFTINEKTDLESKFLSTTIANEQYYNVEFDVMTDESTAINTYAQVVDYFDSLKTDDSEVSYDKVLSNYQKYSLLADNKYYVVARIDNTIVYCTAYHSYKYEINNILKELGY